MGAVININKFLKAQNWPVRVRKQIGHGAFATAYETNSPKLIVKISTDKREWKVMGNLLKTSSAGTTPHLVRVYKAVIWRDRDGLPYDSEDVCVILAERLYPAHKDYGDGRCGAVDDPFRAEESKFNNATSDIPFYWSRMWHEISRFASIQLYERLQSLRAANITSIYDCHKYNQMWRTPTKRQLVLSDLGFAELATYEPLPEVTL